MKIHSPLNPTKTDDVLRCILCAVICALILSGCASISHKRDILAVVDGEPITEADLEYSLDVAHRRENLSSAGDLNISQYLQKLIDERLIIQEARRMGMDEYPEVQKKIDAYILRESVMRLYEDEIASKVTVSEEDIVNFYKENYERLSLGIIEVDSKEDADKILAQLKNGEDFMELARKYSAYSHKNNNGTVTLRRNALSPALAAAVSGLKPGEITGVTRSGRKYYILKLMDRQEAPDDELPRVRKNIERAIRRQREAARSDEYLKYLREKADLKINREILASIDPSVKGAERERLLKDKRPLVELDGSILTVGEFAAMIPKNYMQPVKKILDNWIDSKLVDTEALSRHYEKRSPLKGMVFRYRNQVLMNTFIKEVLSPNVKISDKDLKDYYLSHKEDFLRPVRYNIQQITLKTREEAEDTLRSLQNGADFAWLAKNRSVDEAASRGGNIGWVAAHQLPGPAREIVKKLKPGEISPVLEIKPFYRIIRLQKKTGKEPYEFDRVKEAVRRRVFAEKYRELYDGYVDRLKQGARIKIYNDAVESFEKMFMK
ncbi:MAG: hypothetical protein GXP46_03600 [Deferribacteres bacterium]|nr:hypothetical protein [Deferribacteres bacterium]